MYDRWSDRARKVMQLANQEAQRFNHEYVGTEHVLLGLIKENGGVAASILASFGVAPAAIRKAVEDVIQSGPDMVTVGKLPLTPRAKHAIELAMQEAHIAQCPYVGTEHVLLGIMAGDDNVAAQVLQNWALDRDKVRDRINSYHSHGAHEAVQDLTKQEEAVLATAAESGAMSLELRPFVHAAGVAYVEVYVDDDCTGLLRMSTSNYNLFAGVIQAGLLAIKDKRDAKPAT